MMSNMIYTGKVMKSGVGLFFASLFTLTACNNDKFLDVDHYSILPYDQMFKSESNAAEGLVGVYDLLFPTQSGTFAESDWNYKPQVLTGGHTTLDTQATGWDSQWCTQGWAADDRDLGPGWKYAYAQIGRANDFLNGLENLSESEKSRWKSYDYMCGEAHALRAYFYLWLVQNFGRVPMLMPGETYSNTPEKGAPETDIELWDYLIEDFNIASELLDWKPFNGEYGRATKGMALSYMAECYLWKAYRQRVQAGSELQPMETSESLENVKKAKDYLETVINSGTYELVPCFSTLWDPGVAWPKEAVWQVVIDMGEGNYNKFDQDCHIMNNMYAASPNGGGGWGSEYISWELYFAYENGDKRRDYSLCTNPVQGLPAEQRSQYTFGYNPFLQQRIGPAKVTASQRAKNDFMHNSGGEYAPSVWSLKMWRTQRATVNWYNDGVHNPMHFYQKRYSGVLFDYAECLFRLNGGDDATAWALIDQIRNRAWGNDEVGKKTEIEATFLPYYKSLINNGDNYLDYEYPTHYPIPLSEATVAVPDAKTYYTKYASEDNEYHKSFTAYGLQPWEVALGQERRKEFNSEFYLKADLQRSGFLIPSIECNYPKGVGLPNTDPEKHGNWHYYRTWDFNPQKLLMPIPTGELLRNSLLKQNPSY